MTIDNLTKEDIVLSLIKKATEYPGTESKGIHGKKALQKSLYLFNQKFNMFSYRWGDYGPLCGEIQHIAEDLITKGHVIITDVPTKKQEAVIKNLQFSDSAYDVTIPDDVNHELDETVSFVAGRSPRDLELLASVHFWAVRQQDLMDEYSVEYILEKLTELKPDAHFIQKDVEYAIDVLETHTYLLSE